MLKTFNYAKHFENSNEEKCEAMENVLRDILFLTQAESDSNKKTRTGIDDKMKMVQTKMEIEIYEQEVIYHMYDRTREDTVSLYFAERIRTSSKKK